MLNSLTVSEPGSLDSDTTGWHADAGRDHRGEWDEKKIAGDAETACRPRLLMLSSPGHATCGQARPLAMIDPGGPVSMP